MPQVQFAAGSYQSRNRALSDQRCINFFSEQAPSKEAEAQVGVFGSPGLSEWVALLDNGETDFGPVRGYRIMNGLLYVVTVNFYSVAADGTVIALNTIPVDGTAPVSISDNGKQIVFVTGTNGYCYQPGGINQALSATAATGDTVLTFAVVTGPVAGGDPFYVTLDSGALFHTTVVSATDTTVTIADPLPSQATLGAVAVDQNVSFAQIVQSDNNGFYPTKTITYIDGYFVLERIGTKQFIYSALLDGVTYPGLNYGSKESNPDNLVAVANLHQTLVLLGERTIELLQDTGSYPGPFQLIPGAVVQRGTVAPLSVLVEDNSLFFIGNDLVFYRLDNYQPVRLSTHVIETAWAGYAAVADAHCCVVVWEGHKFIHVTFPSAPATWVYDIATGLWHERESWGATNVSAGRWRGNCAIQCYGMVLVGDVFTGTICKWDYDAFTELGCTMRGLLSSPPIHKDRKRVFVSVFETYWETGVGLASGQGSDPQVFLEWSDDGGRTWSPAKLPSSIGKMGAYKQRTRWLRGGQFRTRTYRLTVTDPVRRNLVGAYLDASVGM